jgi:hypothetical protein
MADGDLTCIHAAAGLCKSCRAQYDEDPGAFVEYGDHPAGLGRWRRLLEEIAAGATRASREGARASLDDLDDLLRALAAGAAHAGVRAWAGRLLQSSVANYPFAGREEAEEGKGSLMDKHTPVPWTAAALGGSHCYGVFAPDGAAVAYLSDAPAGGAGLRGREVDRANAELIARAVNSHAELLAACEEALVWADSDGLKERLRAAIAKAKGGAA